MRGYVPVGLFLLVVIAVHFSGLTDVLSPETVMAKRQAMQDFAASNPVLAPLAFAVAYLNIAALALPVTAILGLPGGFLFGVWLGALFFVISVTIGTPIVFALHAVQSTRRQGQQSILSVGDVANCLPRNLPKSGVYSVRQGPILSESIRRLVAGGRLRHYSSQRDTLYLLLTGQRHAIGTLNDLAVEGDWVWRFNDWRDRCRMSRYQAVGSRDTLQASLH
jgi:hypothetical protein